jgi:Uma2 family endonuclease
MSTIAPTPVVVLPPSPSFSPSDPSLGDERLVFRGVDWHTYNQLSESRGDGQHVHLIYDGKDLEIMVIGNVHEIFKGRISKIINAVAMGRRVNHVDAGQATRRAAERGLESDLSYYFDAEKIRVVREALRRRARNPADYPSPDMSVEIDMSPSQVDRPAVYRDLRVIEVWRFVRGEQLIIEQLQPDGSYAPVQESQFLGISADQIISWMKQAEEEPDESAWLFRLTQWALTLGPKAP